MVEWQNSRGRQDRVRNEMRMPLSSEPVCDVCEKLDKEFVHVRNRCRIAALHAGLDSAEATQLMELEDDETFRLIGRMSDHKSSDHTR